MKEDDIMKPVVRRNVRSIDANVKTGYSPSLARWGYRSQVQLEPGEPMRKKLAACFAGVKTKLAQEVPGILFNPPEIFPIDTKRCIVLITGWKPESIMLQS